MTNWEKLESMKDKDIDFSDCPEITAEMAKNAVVRRGLKSSFIILFSNSILERKLLMELNQYPPSR
ncbi:hypothetical protein [Geminocystis sp. GBBB08]|uniref:hypothetical protein n=1 Tax=Geminocystis sp. GBBB08 TaxID=2604140 RepID=UPI0027E31A46|nr:hypothetical protein [Geminocystis sp. GBBB08]MBL1209139.1 hypothetical protein [Geminocystis sp. GBBB08]